METIYTIPVNEAFDAVSADPTQGCPLCLLYKKLEENELDLILGASMMEPDIRIMTNEKGFCRRHYDKMFHRKNRLGLALMLESHLPEVKKKAAPSGVAALIGGKAAEAEKLLGRLNDDCYVCGRIETNLSRMTETVILLFSADREFRKKYMAAPFFCLPHYKDILAAAKRRMKKKELSAFYEVTEEIEKKKIDSLREDVSWFCKKFDYRYDSEPWYNAKDAVERTIAFLSGSIEE